MHRTSQPSSRFPFSKVSAACSALLLSALLSPSRLVAQEDKPLTRSLAEEQLVELEAAYRASPGDDENRRAYAKILYTLGNMWEANDVMAPLAATVTSIADDVLLGARLAYLVGAYDRAEILYERLRTLSTPDSEMQVQASEGLLLVHYQTNRYDLARGIELPGSDATGRRSLLAFMKKFEGEPHQVEWMSSERVTRLPMINDYTEPGALPLFRLKVNGHEVEFILDTGGDRLYIDEEVAAQVGIRKIHERRSRYAYTGGEEVGEPLGVADSVTMGNVRLTNVPVIVAKWKALGLTSDGVITTQVLKQFLSTVDYDVGELVLRERAGPERQEFLASLGGNPVRMPFWMSATHLMYTKGSVNGRSGFNVFMDSGLASSMPLVILDETVEELGISETKVEIEGADYYWVPIETHGIGSLTRGATQALGNVFVEEDAYKSGGFFRDVLVSHQYLRHFGSWTIDFETMSYYFPEDSRERAVSSITSPDTGVGDDEDFRRGTPEDYAGSYEVAPGVSLEVTVEVGEVFLQAPGQQRVGMQQVGEDAFSIPLANAQVSFERGDAEQVTALVIEQAGTQTRGLKR